MKYLVAELTVKAIKAWYENQQICIRLAVFKSISLAVGESDL
jgi:hypothetical protein